MAKSEADRNLLFGILALQMDFITRDELVTAMHAWVLDKIDRWPSCSRRGALRPRTATCWNRWSVATSSSMAVTRRRASPR